MSPDLKPDFFRLQPVDPEWDEGGSDPLPPRVEPSISGLLGNDGWYRSNVTVTWNVFPRGAPPTSSNGCGDTVITDDTPSITLTCTVLSNAGEGSASVTIKRDATPPVKFSLGGDRGLNVFASGSPRSRVIACDRTAPEDVVEETVNPVSSSLSYDPVTQRYTYAWKTERSWNGCRRLTLTFTDGQEHTADFRFRR